MVLNWHNGRCDHLAIWLSSCLVIWLTKLLDQCRNHNISHGHILDLGLYCPVPTPGHRHLHTEVNPCLILAIWFTIYLAIWFDVYLVIWSDCTPKGKCNHKPAKKQAPSRFAHRGHCKKLQFSWCDTKKFPFVTSPTSVLTSLLANLVNGWLVGAKNFCRRLLCKV